MGGARRTPGANAIRANPGDPEAAINYAQALRGNGQRAQAVAVLEQASMHNPKHMGVLGAYGRALADVGNYKQALDVLNRAHAPEQPDWRILSVQGAVLDQMGRHEEAQRYYATALRIAPDEPSVLSNLGLSYALSKDLVRAETTLRRAAGQSRVDPRVRQNLALVVGLQGRFAEAEGIARRTCRPTKRQPMSPICGRCWRSKTAGDSPAMRARSSSGLREADRINKCFPLGGGRASGGGEPERSDQGDEQRGANQRYVSHLVPLHPRSSALAQCRGDPALAVGCSAAAWSEDVPSRPCSMRGLRPVLACDQEWGAASDELRPARLPAADFSIETSRHG